MKPAPPPAEVAAYLAALPADRRPTIVAVRDAVVAGLPAGYEEGVQFGVISWHVPLERYPDTYNDKPLGLVGLANQKNYMALYLMGVYASADDRAWFQATWKATGKKLNMGKSCVRFKRLDDVPLAVVTEAVARTPVDEFIERYEASRAASKKSKKQKK